MGDNSDMAKGSLSVSVRIEAPAEKIWPHLIKPELIMKYFFGTQVETDWKPGSPIYFRGEWQGKAYEDKGKILEFKAHEKIAFTYWSAFSGLADLPENYQIVTYELRPDSGQTLLELRQSNISTDQMKEHSEKNWRIVLDGLKAQIESGA